MARGAAHASVTSDVLCVCQVWTCRPLLTGPRLSSSGSLSSVSYTNTNTPIGMNGYRSHSSLHLLCAQTTSTPRVCCAPHTSRNTTSPPCPSHRCSRYSTHSCVDSQRRRGIPAVFVSVFVSVLCADDHQLPVSCGRSVSRAWTRRCAWADDGHVYTDGWMDG